jgi:hypothetical protein
MKHSSETLGVGVFYRFYRGCLAVIKDSDIQNEISLKKMFPLQSAKCSLKRMDD